VAPNHGDRGRKQMPEGGILMMGRERRIRERASRIWEEGQPEGRNRSAHTLAAPSPYANMSRHRAQPA
jgi:hypothetical protein